MIFLRVLAVGDEGIENLLYEVIGYSLAKTSKLNKAFIFKGNRQKSARARCSE